MANNSLCNQVKQVYEKVVYFKKNLFNVPANKTGKLFLEKFAETIEWAASNDEEQHLAWYANVFITAIFLQIKDRKSNAKQRTAVLKERLAHMEEGRIDIVIREAIRIQQDLGKRNKRRQNRSKKPNWISTIRQKVQEGEMNCAARMLEKNNLGVEQPSEETFNRMQNLFPRRKKPFTFNA